MSMDEILKTIRNTGGNSEKEILNNPYYYAVGSQKIATEIATSLNYIKLLLFPSPLSADYSYNTLPYRDFGDWLVYLSLLIHGTLISLIGYFGFVLRKYKIIGFAIAFYIIHLLLVNNIVFDIGATMGERLIFHSSVGFSIIVALLLYRGAEKIQPLKTGQTILAGTIVVLIVIFGFITINRNNAWKNDGTLFAEDIKTTPNSILVNANVAAALISKSDYEKDETIKKETLHKAIQLLDKAIDLHQHTFVAGFLNRGIAWYKLGDIDKAKANMDSVKALYPNYPTLKGMYALLSTYYLKNGWDSYGKYGKFPEAIGEFKKGLSFDSLNADLWYNLGGAYFSNHQLPEAVNAWRASLNIKPGNVQAQQGMQAALEMMKTNPQKK